jgi:hypothetical protein
MPATGLDAGRSLRLIAASAAAALALAGCASTTLNAQWSDPQFAGKSLRGAKVLVACQAADATLRRVCADRTAAKLAQLHDARTAGAVAVLRTSVAPAAALATPGPSIGIGIGGFGGGYRGGGGVGFGVSAPVGGGSVETGYGASASISDVASGQLIWSASASAPPSSDLNQQMASLAATLLDAAGQAGLFTP